MEAGSEGWTGTLVCSKEAGNELKVTQQGPGKGGRDGEYPHGDRVGDVVTCSTRLKWPGVSCVGREETWS